MKNQTYLPLGGVNLLQQGLLTTLQARGALLYVRISSPFQNSNILKSKNGTSGTPVDGKSRMTNVSKYISSLSSSVFLASSNLHKLKSHRNK